MAYFWKLFFINFFWKTTLSYRTVCFIGKLSVKIVFHIFQCLVAQKKTSQWKTIFTQRKILIKIKLIFYRLFSKIFFWQTISLSLVASPINIIFFYSHEKHRFLAFSLSHSKLSHFFSILFAFYLFIYSLIWIPSFFFFFLEIFCLIDSRQKLLLFAYKSAKNI